MRGNWASAFFVVALLVACGGDDDRAEVADQTATVLGPSDTAGPATGQPTTVASTTTPTTTTPPTTTPPTTLPPETGCLEGSWWLSPEQTTALYSALLPGMPVTVTGTHWAEFTGETVDYWAVLEARFVVGGADVTFGIDQHGVGTYSVVDDVLVMNYDTFESHIHEGHGAIISNPANDPSTYADERIDIADNGDGTITVNRITLPKIEIPPVAGGPMGCDGATMSLGFTSGLADAAAVFVRMT